MSSCDIHIIWKSRVKFYLTVMVAGYVMNLRGMVGLKNFVSVHLKY